MVTVNPSRGQQQKHQKVIISDQRCDGSTNPYLPQRQSSHIRFQYDNEAAVSVLRSGHAHDTVIQDCAKAALLVQALLGVDIIFDHIPDDDNDMADALSLLALIELKWTPWYNIMACSPSLCVFTTSIDYCSTVCQIRHYPCSSRDMGIP